MSINPIIESIRRSAQIAAENERKEDLQIEFGKTDKKSIKRLSDDELARWQAKYPSDSPQVLFAEQLWKYRLAKHSAKFTAVISITSAIVGGIIGYSIKTIENKVTIEKTYNEPKQNEKPPVTQQANKETQIPQKRREP